jgi:xanthine dehydrogenase YagT iron-sulfur-binding subunit
MAEREHPHTGPRALPRRDFLIGTAGSFAGMAAVRAQTTDYSTTAAENSSEESATTRSLELRLSINGQSQSMSIDPRATLVDLLREQLHMFGTKKGCDHGSCGACTVHIDGRRQLACLTLAATLDGAEVRTIEALSQGEQLHPVQEAFLRCDAYQCGYCTPGQIMSAVSCIEEGHADRSPEEAREWMSGNLCRCSAYPNILAAVRQTAGVEPKIDPADQMRFIPVPRTQE